MWSSLLVSNPLLAKTNIIKNRLVSDSSKVTIFLHILYLPNLGIVNMNILLYEFSWYLIYLKRRADRGERPQTSIARIGLTFLKPVK